jgi:hypothetical protein
VEGGERDAQLGWDVGEGVVVAGANEGVVPVDYLLDHVKFVVVVIRGGVAPPTDGVGVMVRKCGEGHGAVQD